MPPGDDDAVGLASQERLRQIDIIEATFRTNMETAQQQWIRELENLRLDIDQKRAAAMVIVLACTSALSAAYTCWLLRWHLRAGNRKRQSRLLSSRHRSECGQCRRNRRETLWQSVCSKRWGSMCWPANVVLPVPHGLYCWQQVAMQTMQADMEYQKRVADWEAQDKQGIILKQHDNARRAQLARAKEEARLQQNVETEIFRSELEKELGIRHVEMERKLRSIAEKEAALTAEALEAQRVREEAMHAEEANLLKAKANEDQEWYDAQSRKRAERLARQEAARQKEVRTLRCLFNFRCFLLPFALLFPDAAIPSARSSGWVPTTMVCLASDVD